MHSEASICPEWLCTTVLGYWRMWLPDDVVLRFAVYSALGLALATLLVMIQVLVFSELAMRRERRRQAFNLLWRPIFAQWSLGGEPDGPLPSLSRGQRLWFLLQWNRTQLHLRGGAQERMNAALRALGMQAVALRLLQGRPQARLIGLSCLRHLADAEFWPAVEQLTQHRNPIVVLAALQTLTAIDASRAMRLTLTLAQRRQDLALPRLIGLCRQAGPGAVTPALLDVLLGPDEDLRTRMAALLPYADPRAMAPWARHHVDFGSTASVQIRYGLQCLGELADPIDRSRILARLDDRRSAVRHAAVEAFAHQATRNDDTALLPLLADENWWVRQAAADALVALPGMDSVRLARMLAQTTDRYGQDALRRAIAEVRR